MPTPSKGIRKTPHRVGRSTAKPMPLDVRPVQLNTPIRVYVQGSKSAEYSQYAQLLYGALNPGQRTSAAGLTSLYIGTFTLARLHEVIAQIGLPAYINIGYISTQDTMSGLTRYIPD